MTVSTPARGRGRTIQSLARALDLLELLCRHGQELGVTELAHALRLSKSTVHGLISTLVHRGYLRQNPVTAKYWLGVRLLELGSAVETQLDLVQLATPVIRHLVDEYRETAHLVTHDEGEVVYIHKLECSESLRMCSQVGRRLPLHCTGVGKAIAAFLPPYDLDAIVARRGLPARTGNTITDLARFRSELATIRAQGVAFDHEEAEEGLKCVAAPIFDHQGLVVAALSLAGPAYRIDAKRTQLVAAVRAAAMAVSTSLGHRPLPAGPAG